MQKYRIPHTDLETSRLAYGCMGIARTWHGDLTADDQRHALRAVETALASGINFFDHADIYCGGKSESAFAAVWNNGLARRSDLIVQSKCGIRFPGQPAPGDPHRYDFSHAHIVHSVEGILRRLQTGYLDILLLHRPDVLMEPEEVAQAFDELSTAGKVRHFGLSNHHPGQIELLRRWVRQPIVINQLEFSVLHTPMLDEAVMVNRAEADPARATGTIEYCRTEDILIQAWSPLAKGRLANPGPDAAERVKTAAATAAEMARARGCSLEAILVAWVLRHPAGLQPVIGTGHPDRIRACAEGEALTMSREEWYKLWLAGRGARLP